MRPIGSTTFSAAAAASQKEIVLTSFAPGNDGSGDAENLAAADYLVWKDTNGVYQYDLIASVVVGTKTATMTSNLPTAVVADDTVWAMYEVGRSSHFVLTPGVSATLSLGSASGIMQAGISKNIDRHNVRNGQGDPLVFHSTNATAAGFLDAMAVEYDV